MDGGGRDKPAVVAGHDAGRIYFADGMLHFASSIGEIKKTDELPFFVNPLQ